MQAVVLFAMGGYGSYLGWQIRLSPDGVSLAPALTIFISVDVNITDVIMFSLVPLLPRWFDCQHHSDSLPFELMMCNLRQPGQLPRTCTLNCSLACSFSLLLGLLAASPPW